MSKITDRVHMSNIPCCCRLQIVESTTSGGTVCTEIQHQVETQHRCGDQQRPRDEHPNYASARLAESEEYLHRSATS